MELKSVLTSLLRDMEIGSNRTFMELKYGMIIGIYRAIPRSNRTFMELKYRHST